MVGAVGVLCRNEGQLLGVDLRLRDHLVQRDVAVVQPQRAGRLQTGDPDAGQAVAVDVTEVEVSCSQGVGSVLVGIDCRAGCGRCIVDRIHRDRGGFDCGAEWR